MILNLFGSALGRQASTWVRWPTQEQACRVPGYRFVAGRIGALMAAGAARSNLLAEGVEGHGRPLLADYGA